MYKTYDLEFWLPELKSSIVEIDRRYDYFGLSKVIVFGAYCMESHRKHTKAKKHSLFESLIDGKCSSVSQNDVMFQK